jgi:hypothetical protein
MQNNVGEGGMKDNAGTTYIAPLHRPYSQSNDNTGIYDWLEASGFTKATTNGS